MVPGDHDEPRRPDLISINARYEEIVAADHADLVVTVEGSSLVTGRAALKKAKEVSALVEELANEKRMGVEVLVQYRVDGFSPPDSASGRT
jgi:hypothetical protein